MRFNNRACALMEIPDLPQGAFEHIGDRKIKPQGGGGGIPIVSDIGKGIESVGKAVSGGLAKIDPGPALGKAGEAIDKAVTQPVGRGLAEVDKFVGREIPGGWVTPALITAAVAAPYLAPTLAGEGAAASGFAGLDAATAAELGLSGGSGLGISGASGNVLAGITGAEAAAAAAEAATALPYTEAFDAFNLAQQGLRPEQIAQNLTISANVDPFIAQDMAQLAAQGLSPQQIVETLSMSYTKAELAPLGIESKALGLPKKGLTAGQALQGARLASGLLGQRPQQPQMQQYQMPQMARMPQGAVDYSGLLSLLTPRTQARTSPYSLLG